MLRREVSCWFAWCRVGEGWFRLREYRIWSREVEGSRCERRSRIVARDSGWIVGRLDGDEAGEEGIQGWISRSILRAGVWMMCL